MVLHDLNKNSIYTELANLMYSGMNLSVVAMVNIHFVDENEKNGKRGILILKCDYKFLVARAESYMFFRPS